MQHRTIDQKPNEDGYAKARELIEIRGTGLLTLHDRRVLNVLYENAGARICDDLNHTIGIAALRGTHKGGERVKDTIIRLQTTLVQMPKIGKNGKPATRRVPILSDTTTSDDEDDPNGQVVYAFSPGMREIIKDSTLWGRIRNAVIFAFTSKYSLTLYEIISARINLKYKWEDAFSLKDFRSLMGVPEDKLLRMPDFLRYCVKVAEAEVNGMADFKVNIEPVRKGGSVRGTVTGFRVKWWAKPAEELRAAFDEIKRSKVGRLERLTGRVQTLLPFGISPDVADALRGLKDGRLLMDSDTTAVGQTNSEENRRAAADAEVTEKLERVRAKSRLVAE
jgi:hypothetical protein